MLRLSRPLIFEDVFGYALTPLTDLFSKLLLRKYTLLVFKTVIGYTY